MILYSGPRVTVAGPSIVPSREAAESLTEHYYYSLVCSTSDQNVWPIQIEEMAREKQESINSQNYNFSRSIIVRKQRSYFSNTYISQLPEVVYFF